jgi:signal transduction histidine kinase
MAFSLWRRTTIDSAPAIALLLLLIVALPAAGMLWLVSEAARNEHLAVRQRLTSAYHAQLELLRLQVVADWQKSIEKIGETVAHQPAGEAFASCISESMVDGLVVLDANEEADYPTLLTPPINQPPPTSEWLAAEQLEFTDRDYVAAAAAYQEIATSTTDENLFARAVQSQVRSLLAAGRDTAAIELIEATLAGPRLRKADDGRRRSIDLSLLLVDRTKEANPSAAVDRLATELNNYGPPPLVSAERRFAMHRLQELFPEQASFPTLASEDLSSRYLERSNGHRPPHELTAAGLADVWQIAVAGDRAVALYRTRTLTAQLQRHIDRQASLSGVSLTAEGPGESSAQDAFLSLPLGAELPGWRISLSLTGDDPFAGPAREQRLVYFGTALLTIVATAGLALLAGFALRRQRRIVRLKNELVATVSHELKTPLSGIRLLVDTLLADEPSDREQTQSYLQMIAQENARLSRLIDSFLNFSRMERGQQQFTLAPVPPADIVARAVAAVHERFCELGCQLESRCDPGLPTIQADREALVTVLVNLLDNAGKYGGDSKHVMLRAFATADRVCFAVTDQGIGLSARHRRKVFDRFYQVDQQLTRPAGGCGLGLAIVRHIVTAHSGTVEVESRAGHGSTFTVTLPAAEASVAPSQSDRLCTKS